MYLSDHLNMTAPLENRKYAGARGNIDNVGEGIVSGSRGDAVGIRIGFTDALNQLLV